MFLSIVFDTISLNIENKIDCYFLENIEQVT